MIVRMKEILLFTLASAVNETIYKLGELGVVDIADQPRFHCKKCHDSLGAA